MNLLMIYLIGAFITAVITCAILQWSDDDSLTASAMIGILAGVCWFAVVPCAILVGIVGLIGSLIADIFN